MIGTNFKDVTDNPAKRLSDSPLGKLLENFSETLTGKYDSSLAKETCELTDKEKAKMKEETGWSDEIIDAIGSWKEYEIYKNAGLIEAEIGGRKCLLRNDIDWDQKDAEGRTNKERVNLKPPEGPLVPINKNGERIELHHIGQHADSPFAELTMKEHRGKENYSILHDTMKEDSEIDRNKFSEERNNHWQARASEGVENT